MSTPLSLYPVNTASSVLSHAGLLVSAGGSSTTAAPTTLVGASPSGWGEIAFNGNAGPWAAAGSEPSPTGYGALFDASSSVLVAQMLLAGNWNGVLKLFNTGATTTLSYDHLKLRFWKWTSGTAISSATAIGSIDLGIQSTNNTATNYTFPNTSGSATNFAPSGNDYLYIDCVAHITGSTNTTATTKIKMDVGASNLTNGNSAYTIGSPGYQPTPVLAVTSSTLSYSATAGGANPANQTETLSETSGTGTAWTSSIVYGSGSGWLAISPISDTLAAGGTSETVTFSCTTGALSAGTYTATVTFTATTGGAQVTVTVSFTVNPSGTLVYSDSPYAMTRYVNGNNKTALSFDSIALFSSFTQGGTIPFFVRYQYSWQYIETSKNVYQWGPLDESVDKMMATPGLRFIFNLAYAPSWWQAIDANGKYVGYGAGTAVLPDGPAMANFASIVATRYKNFINSGKIVLQIGNEEYDTALNGPVGGTILAYTMNYAIPAILAVAPNAIVIAGSVRPGSHPNGAVTQQWMTNFYTYKPGTISGGTEPKQALPYAHDFHFYDDSATVETTKYPAPDPTVTDNSANPLAATKVAVQQVISIMAGVLSKYNPNAQIWNLENGYSLPNESPNNHNSSPSDLPSQQSRYTRDVMAQLWYAQVGGKYAVYSMLDNGNDPRALTGQSITDLTTFISGKPQWNGLPAPTQYLYTSVDTLSFEGTPSTKPPDQYFSIMNPTGTPQAWSLSSNQTWLSAVTLPPGGMKGTGGGQTSGTLGVGSCITLKCSADSTVNGLSTLVTLGGTLTVTIGSTDYTITVNLFVAPNAANPNITSNQAGPSNGLQFTMAVNATPPVSQAIVFTNADTSYATWWYAFTTANWFSIDVASGTLSGGSNQTINVSMNSIVSSFAPGTYHEVVTISATPFPTAYVNTSTPAVTQFITIDVKLTVQVAHTPTIAVQVSTPTLLYQAVASGALPASQTFFLLNCTNHAENWTVADGSYAGGGSGWLSFDTTSGSNLPANGSTNGVPSPNQQATDYQVVTASVNTTALSVGTHTANITVTLGGTATQTIAVTYVVSGSGGTQTIGASPSSLSFSATVGGANPASQTVTLTNSGTQSGTYGNKITYIVGTGWIASVTPGSGQLPGGGGTQVVTISVQTGNLTAGTYTGKVTFSIGAATSVDVNITFTVSAVATQAAFSASPQALAFSATVGGTDPAGQVFSVTNVGGQNGTWSATIAYINAGNNQGWLTLSPLSGVLGSGVSQNVSAFVDDTNLAAGTYTATVTISGGSSPATVQVTFIVSPQAPAAAGSLSNLLSLAVQKTQVVKVYDASGNFLGVWRDAPHLVGLRQTMNAADSQVKMTLPRKIDAFGGAGQPGTDNSVVLGNNVQVWLYGPGLPTAGLLKLNGVIDLIEPAIDASGAESTTVTITPYGSVVADHGIPGSLTLTNVDPLAFFTYWFNNIDPTPQLGGVTYADPLTLSSACASSSGLTVTYTILNQNIKSVLDAMMLMLGNGWFWRVNPDRSALVSQLSPTAQHILILGQHISTLSGLQDQNARKNVVRFVGSTGVAATAVSTSGSALPPKQGGIGERLAFYQDSRITDNGSAQVMATGILSLLDQPLTRMKCRLPDYRGDTKTGLGYDIESLAVGDTVSIRDARQVGLPTVWGSFKWGNATWGRASGAVFNMIIPILSIDYQWDFCDIEVGVYQPSLNKQLYQIRTKLQDFTTGFG